MSRVASAPSPNFGGGTLRRGCTRGRGRTLRRALITLVVWVVLCGARSSAASLDDQVHAIARQLMCPVCAGQTVAESDSALAREMKTLIRQKLLAGETPDQIVRYFVGQFGDSVLAEPRPGGVSLILYAAPPMALIAGVAIAVVFIQRARARAGSRNTPPDREAVPPLHREA